MRLSRRRFLAAAAAAPAAVPKPGQPFTAGLVKDRAVDLAKHPYAAPTEAVPAEWKALDYPHFRQINFRSEHAFWRDRGLFRVELFHRGFQYDRKVAINLVENGIATEIAYAPELFDFGSSGLKPKPDKTLGFSGFRLHFPLNKAGIFDEFAVFQGASYFRLVGRGQQYGLSARGLALDTGGPQGEEFPVFREFWIERPSADSSEITVHALLDSKSTTGAYRFSLMPGGATRAKVEAVLYPRAELKKPGLAPLTSMFLHGKPSNRPFADLRPEVHDSDGLLCRTGTGEWLWRPLIDPRGLQIASFGDKGPRGFGLMQRERRFEAYEDPEDDYQRRPSAWIEPEGDWAEGAVELVEIPSDQEVNDNIVAAWIPRRPIPAGAPFPFAYRLQAFLDDPALPPTGRAYATRSGPTEPVEAAKDDRHGARRLWVDFIGGDLETLGADQPLQAIVTASTGRIGPLRALRLPDGAWRAAFDFQPDGRKDSELRAYLSLRGQPLTETWSWRWTAE
jgi:glucans biosynthesis protein